MLDITSEERRALRAPRPRAQPGRRHQPERLVRFGVARNRTQSRTAMN